MTPRSAILLLAAAASPGLAQISPPFPAPDQPNAIERAADAAMSWVDAQLAKAKAALDAPPTNGPPRGVSFLEPAPGDASLECPELRWVPLVGQDSPVRIVVLVHGLDEPGNLWDCLGPALAREGFYVARFDYPNDQAISLSSAALVEALRDLHTRGARHVSIVGHSMGGLVARDAITRVDGYCGIVRGRYDLPQIERLITVGTPYNGSEFARLRAFLEIRERLARVIEPDDADLLDLFRNDDGDGEAGRDLTPGSDFLRSLAARPMPADLPVTLILARWVSPETAGLSELLGSPRARSVLGNARADSLLAGLARASEVVGDGVVTKSSACGLDADDTVFVDADHRSALQPRGILDTLRPMFLCDDHPAREPPAIPEILSRLR